MQNGMRDDMRGKVALVTGAAGGVGAAVSRRLSGCGASVAAVDVNKDRLMDEAAALSADGLDVHAFPADVTAAEEVARTVEEVERALGPIDYLVNAAGVLRIGEAGRLTDQDWAQTFAVNATGVFLTARAVVPRMVSRSSGAIVTIASNAASTARMEMSAYAASKAAATMFTKCLGLEVARHGIRCNVVAPGSTDTDMLASMWQDENGARNTIEGRPDAFRVGIPLGRIALPLDVANAVAFLLSDRARHITMHALTVDGGAALGV